MYYCPYCRKVFAPRENSDTTPLDRLNEHIPDAHDPDTPRDRRWDMSERCPECLEEDIAVEGGCPVCVHCGWSDCA